jgi:hypothetical protein
MSHHSSPRRATGGVAPNPASALGDRLRRPHLRLDVGCALPAVLFGPARTGRIRGELTSVSEITLPVASSPPLLLLGHRMREAALLKAAAMAEANFESERSRPLVTQGAISSRRHPENAPASIAFLWPLIWQDRALRKLHLEGSFVCGQPGGRSVNSIPGFVFSFRTPSAEARGSPAWQLRRSCA